MYEPPCTENVDPDFDHFVSSWALSVDDVSTTVAHLAVGDHHHRSGVGGVDLK